MLWLLTVVTTGVLVLIAGFVKEISKVPTQWSQVCQEVVFCGKAKPGHLSQS